MKLSTEPVVYCDTCSRQRQCSQHMRAAFPPDAASKWLLKSCKTGGCHIQYQAGVTIGLQKLLATLALSGGRE